MDAQTTTGLNAQRIAACRRMHDRMIARLALPALMLLLLAGCGEPPSIQSSESTKSATTQTQTAANTAGPATPAAPTAPRPAPGNVPADADVLTSMTPGTPGGQLVLALPGDPKTFNPILGDSLTDQFIDSLHSAPLYDYDWQRQTEIPGIAKNWEYNEKTREWTFHLRHGVRWSDGQPLTASDFIFFTEVSLNPTIINDFNYNFRLEAKPDSPPYEFRAPDPYTLVVKIPGVDSFAFTNLGNLRALPRHVLEKTVKEGKFSTAWGQNVSPDELVVSGPFKLKSLRLGESAIFERNPYYWRYDGKGQQLPYLNRVVMLIVPDHEAMELRFLAGDIDLLDASQGATGIKPDNLARFEDEAAKGNFTVDHLGPGFDTSYFTFNTNLGGSYTDASGARQTWQPSKRGERPPANLKNFKPFVDPVKLAWFANPEFRIACSELTNRQRIINGILFGQGAELYGPIPPANKVWYTQEIAKFPYNPESAKKRLEKIGFIDRNGDGLREDPQGHTLRFTMITNRENNIREKVIQVLKEDFQKAGIDMQTAVQDFNTMTTSINSTYDFDAYLMGFGSGVPPHPSMESNIIPSSSRLHFGYPLQKVPATDWESKIDALYGQMKQTFNQAEQQKLYFQYQQIFTENQPAIHIYSQNVNVASRNRIGGLRPAILRGSLTHNIHELYVKK